MENIAICPGTFDPLTNGHLDIISRGANLFDKLYVVILNNESAQNPLFTIQERMNLIKDSTKDFPNVYVDAFNGLLVDYARKVGATFSLKGLRAVSDFEIEIRNASMNKSLHPELESIFIMTRTEHSFLSSSIVKEIATYGADVSELVPPPVEKALKIKFAAKQK